MSFLKSIRSNTRTGDPDATSPDPGVTDGNQDLTDRYAKLNERDAIAELARLNQADLSVIARFERSHRDRPPVLDKLRYLRQPEPLPGYDALEPNAIPEALAGADAGTVKAVREYERKHQNRTSVNVAIARALKSLRDEPGAGADGAPTPPLAGSQPPVAGNGLPVKTPPESGLGTP
jgi:hypothetical protein